MDATKPAGRLASPLTEGLGPLPEARIRLGEGNSTWDKFSREQMLAYAAQEVVAERERCAVAAWNHYMDTCRKTGRAPTIWHEWCASDAIRRA